MSQIYDVVNYAFGNLVFTKVEIKETDVVYAACITSSFEDGSRKYILAFVTSHLAIEDQTVLRKLPWHNIQARILKNSYRLHQQRWDLPRDVPKIHFDLVERFPRYTSYAPDNGEKFCLLLLHDDRKKSSYQYSSHVNIIQAILTFACVLNDESGRAPWDRETQQSLPTLDLGPITFVGM